jgi:hypothetical protein
MPLGACEVLTHPLVIFIAGALTTWLITWCYYKRAGDELRAEAKSLHIATGAIVYFLENPDAKIEVKRDDKGRVSGLTVGVSGRSSMTFATHGTLTDTGQP